MASLARLSRYVSAWTSFRQISTLRFDTPPNSQAPATVERVKRRLGGHPVDFLFIDADHSEAGVRADYAPYSPLVRHGDEHREFIGSPVAYGIGILRVSRPEAARSAASGA